MADKNDELNLAKDQASGNGKGKGSMKIIIIVVAALLILGGGGAAYFLLSGDSEAVADQSTDGSPAQPAEEPEKDPIYLSLSPAFVVNFQHKGQTRYLQIDLQIMAYEQGALDRVEANMPAVRNDLILLFSDQDYDYLSTTEGKENLRKTVLDSINKAVRAKADQRVEEVFFTGFVMQ